MVEDNHKLIYWIAIELGLNLDDWYDLLAIELCYTVQKFNPDRGALSNYYKTRCESLVKKEYAKTQAQKNKHNGMVQLTDIQQHTTYDDVEEMVELEEIFSVENGEILRLKASGYTQSEIADRLGVTQSYISKILNKMKKEYYGK